MCWLLVAVSAVRARKCGGGQRGWLMVVSDRHRERGYSVSARSGLVIRDSFGGSGQSSSILWRVGLEFLILAARVVNCEDKPYKLRGAAFDGACVP